VIELKRCEVALDEGPEWLWRQVHPNFVSGDRVSAEAFVGTPEARSEVSTVRSSVRIAEQAFVYHTTALGLASAGSWAVSVDEVKATGSRAIGEDLVDSCAGERPSGPPEQQAAGGVTRP